MSEATIDERVEEEVSDDRSGISRRNVLRAGAVGVAAVGLGAGTVLMQPSLAGRGLLSKDGLFNATSIALADSLYDEVFPTSPLILTPFTDPLLIPPAATPLTPAEVAALPLPPGPGIGQQNSFRNETHQLWPDAIGFPDPIVYKFDLLVRTHSFTSSQVMPIDKDGKNAKSFDATGRSYPAGTVRTLPPSTIYGFNGTFPGPRINAEYGKPCLVRFENHLDENPLNLDRQDFGSPDYSFLTHLHNGHTAPESDGNPHYSFLFGPRAKGYPVQSFVDNLYLNWPAGNDSREKQSFFWFHDHRMDHTGPNVYKGMVGLYPIYDPENNLDAGDETQGLRLPGVRTNHADGVVRRRVRHPARAVRHAASTTASPTTRTSTTARASSRPPGTRGRTRSGGARRSSSTSPTTGSSATSSPSTARPTRCWRSSGASTASASSTRRSRGSTTCS